MSYVAVLQARTNSSRLPGKVLLPINGIPLVVLAAKRAANKGLDVIVATSKERSDDALVRVLQQNNIPFYRGSLNNTLQRVVEALSAYNDETKVFRLTADNVLPDGFLLRDVADDFESRKLNYICCNGEESGLPYGVSVELTYLKHLRKAALSTRDKSDQEHVTPFIRRHYGTTCFTKYKDWALGHYRCTVDCLDDYLALERLFSNVVNPTEIVFTELLASLKSNPFQPINVSPASKLIIGTAQLGMSYGINNKSGQPTLELAEKIIKRAITNGIEGIDTARAYGNSEKVIGSSLKSGWLGRVPIFTKLEPLDNCPNDSNDTIINSFVDCSIYKSINNLGVDQLDVIMLHRAKQITAMEGKVLERLVHLQHEGKLKCIGASIQSPQELELALNNRFISYIQMPYNLLDWRWDQMIPLIRKKQSERNLQIHVRSTLLQGLLVSDSYDQWARAHVDDARYIFNWLSLLMSEFGINDKISLCLKFAQSQKWINGVVVGMESIEQLNKNIEVFCDDILSSEMIEHIVRTRPIVQEKTLNPALWTTSK